MLLTRSYHSADCDSNRSLTCCKFKPPPEKLHCFKHLGKPRTDKNIIQHLEKQCNTASRSWNHLHEAIQKSALATFGRRTSKNCDWFEAKSEKLIPVIVTKRASVAETSAHQLRRSSKESDQPGAKYSREQEDGATSTGGSSVTTSRLQQQQASLGAYMRASRKSWTNLEQNSTPENQLLRSDQRQSLADVEMGGALLRAVLQREGCCHLSNGRLCQSWRS